MGVRRAASLAAIALLVGAGVAGCGEEPRGSVLPGGNPILQQELEETGLQLYAVDLRDAVPEKVRIDDAGKSVTISYTRDGYGFFSLTVTAEEPGDDPCAPLLAEGNNDCAFDGELLVTSFEEMSQLRYLEDGQQLIISSLVTEADRDLEDDAADALRDARPVDAATVSAY